MKITIEGQLEQASFKTDDFFIADNGKIKQLIFDRADGVFATRNLLSNIIDTRHAAAKTPQEAMIAYVRYNGPVKKVEIKEVIVKEVGFLEKVEKE